MHGRMSLGEAHRTSMVGQVVDAQWLPAHDGLAEDALARGQVANDRARLGVDAVGDELGQGRPVPRQYPEGSVARPGEFGGGGHNLL